MRHFTVRDHHRLDEAVRWGVDLWIRDAGVPLNDCHGIDFDDTHVDFLIYKRNGSGQHYLVGDDEIASATKRVPLSSLPPFPLEEW